MVRSKAWVSLVPILCQEKGAHGDLGALPHPGLPAAWLGQRGLTSAAGMAGKELAFGTYEVTH